MSLEFETKISNILIIGCGGAGIRAAIEVKNENLSVNVLGKRKYNDAHTVLAAGGINAAFGNIDKSDNWKQHFADTYLEGYEIGNPDKIKILAKESPELVKEIDSWGANFEKLDNGKLDQRFFGAHTYRRTCYSGDYTGKSILGTLQRKALNMGVNLEDNQYVTDLLVKNNTCFGAIAFNIYNGKKVVHLADAVIIASGGHTRIWKRSSSRFGENNGDGFALALKAGCELIDMEMVQFHPTGMIKPKEADGMLVTEAVRGEGGILKNSDGERFMQKYDPDRLELSTRDKVAIANYKEIMEGRGTKNGGVYLDISHKNKEFILKKLPKIYKQFINLQLLDISKYAMEVAPTAHYSMGGIYVSPWELNTRIKGLFACGEVTGGLHGANRLGGNSLAEILIFGKRAGIAASKYSRNLSEVIRCKDTIYSAINRIQSKIKKGKEIGKIIEIEIQEIMWNYCGVIRNKDLLEEGLNKISDLEIRAKDIDISVEKDNYDDLINLFNIEASLLTAKATILSSLNRKESRGAHQRKDFKNKNDEFKKNIIVSLNKIDKKLNIEIRNIKDLDKELKDIVKKTKEISNFRGKLIE